MFSISCICLFVVVVQAVYLRKLTSDLQRQKQIIADVKQELGALLLCERGMGDRIRQQQQQVRSMIERQDTLEISGGSQTSYKQAMVLLQKGASADELIDACDLSRGELELLARLKMAAASVSAPGAA